MLSLARGETELIGSHSPKDGRRRDMAERLWVESWPGHSPVLFQASVSSAAHLAGAGVGAEWMTSEVLSTSTVHRVYILCATL